MNSPLLHHCVANLDEVDERRDGEQDKKDEQGFRVWMLGVEVLGLRMQITLRQG